MHFNIFIEYFLRLNKSCASKQVIHISLCDSVQNLLSRSLKIVKRTYRSICFICFFYLALNDQGLRSVKL